MSTERKGEKWGTVSEATKGWEAPGVRSDTRSTQQETPGLLRTNTRVRLWSINARQELAVTEEEAKQQASLSAASA